MAELFKRNYVLKITNLITNRTITVSKLRCTFKVSKSNSATENKASISVYNLSPENRNSLATLDTEEGTPQVQVELFAGYGTEATLLFRGTGSAYTDWKAPNYITVLNVSDGVVYVTNTTFNKAYPKLTSVDVIIQDVLKASPLPPGYIFKTLSSLKKGRSFSGTVAKVLEDLGNDFGFVYEVNNEINNIYSSINDIRNVSLTTLSGKTGMLGSPRREGSIIKVRCLLIPEIIPNSLVEIDGLDVLIRGTYLVARVTTRGDNYGSDWFMNLELNLHKTMPKFLTLPDPRGIVVA